jgi:hypothetical protein
MLESDEIGSTLKTKWYKFVLTRLTTMAGRIAEDGRWDDKHSNAE